MLISLKKQNIFYVKLQINYTLLTDMMLITNLNKNKQLTPLQSFDLKIVNDSGWGYPDL